MSFKREGDDGSWLRSLQKRRVSELLAEDIPEGEAHLMKNGKFACMVCSHRPVFDTVNMLSVHRSGKKHMANVEYKKKEEEELAHLREIYMDTHHDRLSANSMKMPSAKYKSTGKTFLGSKPYDPRVKRRPDRRRPVVDLVSQEVASTSADTEEPLLTLHRRDFESYEPSQTISEYKKRRRFVSEQKCLELKPYQRRTSSSVCDSNSAFNYNQTTTKQNHVQDNVVRQITGSKDSPSVSLERHNSQPTTSGKVKVKKTPSTSTRKTDHEKAALREKYLKAIASGWKKDRSGCWIKDDNVEFDSDEEPPDLP